MRPGRPQHNLAGLNRRQRRDQLTGYGCRQAATQISRYRLGAIYSSPRLRTCQTPPVVANYYPNLQVVIPDKGLGDQPFEGFLSPWGCVFVIA